MGPVQNDSIISFQEFTLLNLEDYKTFFDETPVALIRTELKTGKFLMANKFAVQLFGFDSIEDLLANGRTSDFYPAEERKKLIHILRKRGIVENYEIRMQTPNKIIWVSARLRISCSGFCIEGSLIDITEKVQLRENQLCVLAEMGKKLDKKIASLAS